MLVVLLDTVHPQMTSTSANGFQRFFKEDRYVDLKNLIYNYRLRKQSVCARLSTRRYGRLIEIGCGMSPMTHRVDRLTVFTDLSLEALKLLRRRSPGGCFVVADATCLPFKKGCFDNAVSSEVLEHIPDDRTAMSEVFRILRPRGRLILTVPHRMAYFAMDDRYVSHMRRYEISGLTRLLKRTGFQVTHVGKILGPLEKIAMLIAVNLFQQSRKKADRKTAIGKPNPPIPFTEPAFNLVNHLYMALVWLEARCIPLSMATVILVDAQITGPADRDG